jgi:methylenetetrahydrofolate reductase (NADPH)
MNISDILKKKKTLSFEVFAPKPDKPMEPLLMTLSELYDFEPDFISCTYGAGGTDGGRTLDVCAEVKKSGHEVMTHLTCVGATRDDIRGYTEKCLGAGIGNVLALRGDLPKGRKGTCGDFKHADELISFLRVEFPNLCVAAAGYPEKHVEAQSFDADVARLKGKQDRGAEFVLTQLCYDVGAYESYMARLRGAGVTLPVVVGVMPLLSAELTIKLTLSNGCSIPAGPAALFGRYGDSPDDFREAGKEYTADLIGRFTEAGADGLHISTLNKHKDVAEILEATGLRARRRIRSRAGHARFAMSHGSSRDV